MDEDALSTLPVEIQLDIYTYLPPNDVDGLRLTSRRLKAVIDGNDKKAYASRTVEWKICRGSTDDETKITIKRHWWRTLYIKNNACASYEQSNRPIDDGGNAMKDIMSRMMDSFVGASVDECLRILTARCGSLSVCIQCKLDADVFSMILPFLKDSHIFRLDAGCELQISKEDAFRHIFLKARELFIETSVFLKNPGLLDERFCKEAARRKLTIKEDGKSGCRFSLYEPPILPMTDEQLMMLLKRRNMEDIEIYLVEGITAQCLQTAVEILLNTTMKFEIQLHVDYIRGIHSLFTETQKEFIQKFDFYDDFVNTIVYLKGERTVKVERSGRILVLKSWTAT